jgi:hypothetical protein
VADVYANGISLGDSLVEAKLSYVYDRGKKKSW